MPKKATVSQKKCSVADQQRKHAHGSQRQVQPQRTGGHGRNLDHRLLPCPLADDQVMQPRPGLRRVQHVDDVLNPPHLAVVDLQEHVTALQARALGRRPRCNLRRGDVARGRHLPQDAVFHLRPGDALDDVQRREAEQRHDDDAGRHRREGSHPRAALAGTVHRVQRVSSSPSKPHTRPSCRSLHTKPLVSAVYITTLRSGIVTIPIRRSGYPT